MTAGQMAGQAAGHPAAAGVPAFPDTDAVGMADLVRTGQTSAGDLLETAIARIEALNPSLNAVIGTRFDEARAEVDAGLPEGPLQGVPILVKDLNMPVAGLPATNGSRLFAGVIAAHDAELVTRYKRAGMIVVGTTNAPEFGLNASTEPMLHGPARNPRQLDHSTGGSSGGSAAAVAVGMVPVAHASDGGGSIRIPASMNGLFGLKPSRGRIPTSPAPTTLAGPVSVHHALTTSVRDSAALLDLSSARLPGTLVGVPEPHGTFADAAARAPRPLRIGLAESFESPTTDPEVLAVLEAAARLCADLGHTVVRMAAPFEPGRVGATNAVLMGAEFAAEIRDRLAVLGRELAEGDLEPFSHVLFEHYRELPASALIQALQEAQRIGWEIGSLFGEFDVLLTPTLAPRVPPLGLLDTTDVAAMYEHASAYSAWTSAFNTTGMPAMSLPVGSDSEGLPIGIQFVADLGQEALLLSLAGQIESAAPWQRTV